MSQVGIFGNMQMAYGVNPTFSGMTLLNRALNLKTGWDFEDFLGGFNGYGVKGSKYFGVFNNAVGSSIYDVAGWGDRPGILALDPAINAAGYAGIRYGASDNGVFKLQAGNTFLMEGEIFLSSLSSAAEEFSFLFGFMEDSLTAGTEHAVIYYLRTVDNNWICVTGNGGAQTITISTVPVVAASWLKFRIEIDGITVIRYYINDVLVATHTTNIPILDSISPGVTITRDNATAVNPIAYLDWLWTHYDLAVTR